MSDLKQLPLWKEFDTKVRSEEHGAAKLALVDKLLERAGSLLDRVIETFPTYTLHNRIHANNVARLMGDLLGNDIGKLTALEAAMLLLAAYYHDIGMVFSNEERQHLQEEESFDAFLEQYAEARLELARNSVLSPSLAEWYCRWYHAERVFVYLNRIEDSNLMWGTISLRTGLGDLCRSHNLSAESLKNDNIFETNYLHNADLRFCAILLRLADILDFDNTRAPEEVYQYLGLKRRDDPRKNASDVEWRKHLNSDGFSFPNPRVPGYPLHFLAGPDQPSVEYDIREFLNVIENELNVCRSVQTHCSDKWRGCLLPGEVDRSQIKSRGYVYGEYRFTLDQNQVLDLFMGENLYSQPYVFVRELLQNALDTSRHRQFYERSNGNAEFEAQPITVTEWTDAEGYQWVRIDDYGMGMTTGQIQKYLLKVGSSYYRSPEFEADKIRYTQKHHGDFTPISRFGVGLLSCFSVCDTVEINTRHVSCKFGSEQQPVRLCLTGTRQFFVMQTGQNIRPTPMPAERSRETEYRRESGISIAVRLDPKKEAGVFGLRDLLELYLLCPSVPVMFEDQPIGNLADFAATPWMTEPTTITVPPEDMKKIEKTLDYNFESPLQVTVLPLNLTKYSPTLELQGQILIAFVHTSLDPSHKVFLPTPTGLPSIHRNLILSLDKEKKMLLSAKYSSVQIHKEEKQHIELLSKETVCKIEKVQSATSWISHNGIAVDLQYRHAYSDRERYFVLDDLHVSEAPECAVGFLTLADSIRPDLIVSRDAINTLTWSFYSALYLAIVRTVQEQAPTFLNHAIRISQLPLLVRDTSLNALLNDPFLQCDNGWRDQPIFDGLNLADFLERKESDKSVHGIHGCGFWELYRACLLRIHCRLVCKVEDEFLFTKVVEGEPFPIREGEKLFPPLFFVPYVNSNYLQFRLYDSVNLNHPFATWLIDVAADLRNSHPAIFNSLKDAFTPPPRTFDITTYQMEQVNSALERLRSLPMVDEHLRPPKTLFLKAEDFRFAE